MRNGKKILSLLLAVCMTLAMFPVNAAATEETATPSTLETDITTKEFVVGQSTTYQFTTKGTVDAGKSVLGTFSFSDPDAVKVEYLETNGAAAGKWFELPAATDFGPSTGFPYTDGATSTFRATFNKSGTFTFTASVVTADAERTVLCTTGAQTVTVVDKVPGEVSTTITDNVYAVDLNKEFTVTTKPNHDAERMVYGAFEVQGPADAAYVLEYYENGTSAPAGWYPLTGTFGPAGGFPMRNITSKFRVNFKTAGEYTVTIYIKDASSNAVVCKTTKTINVLSALPVIDNVTVSAADGLVYTGAAQTLVAVTQVEGDTISYTINGEAAEKPEATNAGTYTVQVTVSRPNHQLFTQTKEVTIAPADITGIDVKGTKNLIYNGEDQLLAELVLENEDDLKADDTVQWIVDGQPMEIPMASTVGIHEVQVKIIRENYNDFTKEVNVLIQGELSLEGLTVTGLSGVYTGEKQEAVIVEKASDCQYTLKYQLDDGDETVDEAAWSEEIPEVTAAGSYIVWVKAEQEYYIDADVNVVPAEGAVAPYNVYIAKQKVEIPAEDETNFIYTGADQTYNIPANENYTVEGNVQKDAKTYTVTVSLNDIANFQWADGTTDAKTYTFVIGKYEATLAFNAEHEGTYTVEGKPAYNEEYDFSAKTELAGEDTTGTITYTYSITANPGEATIDANGKVTVKRPGTYKITANAAINDNYTVDSIERSITVKSAGFDYLSFAGDVTYIVGNNAGVAESALSLCNDYVTGTITYAIDNTAAGIECNETTGEITVKNYTTLVNAVEAAGGELKITVTATKAEDTWYSADDTSYTLVIKLADMKAEDVVEYPAANDNGWYKEKVTVTAKTGYKVEQSVSENADEFKANTEFADNGVLSRKVYLRNTTTGEIGTVSFELKIDTQEPSEDTMDIQMPTSFTAGAVMGTDSFFHKDQATIRFVIKDETGEDESGLDELYWRYLDKKTSTGDETYTVVKIDEGKHLKDGYYEVDVVLGDGNTQYNGEIEFYVLDKAGNKNDQTVRLNENGKIEYVVIDNISPKITVEYSVEDQENTNYEWRAERHYYGNEVKVKVLVEESNFYERNYTFAVNGEKYDVEWKTDAEGVHYFERPLPADGEYVVTVTGKDYSSNDAMITGKENNVIQTAPYEYTYTSHPIIVDTTAPEVTVSYSETTGMTTDDTGVNTYYHNKAVTGTISVVDTNGYYDADTEAGGEVWLDDYVTLKIQDTETEIKWAVVGGQMTGTFTLDCADGKEIDFDNIHLSFQDIVKNPAEITCAKTGYTTKDGEYQEPDIYIIDKILPIVKVKYDNNNVANGKYFNSGRKATITFDETHLPVGKKNLEAASVLTISQERTNTSKSYTEMYYDDNIVINYIHDADIEFDYNVTDLAGNKSVGINFGSSAAPEIFTIDTTYEDMITIGGVENGKAYGYEDQVIPTVNIQDINLDSYTIKLVGQQKGKTIDLTEDVNALLKVGSTEVNGSFDIFKVIQDLDGIYTLTVHAEDKATNVDDETVVFTVNRFGSVYQYDDYLKDLIADGGKYVQDVEQDLTITEYNADKLKEGSWKIEITRDGRPLENVKFSVTPETNTNIQPGESGWYQYKYTISKENFEEDGIYKISISSEDATGNTPENSNYEDMGISFRVDSTAAEISSVVGLEEAIINAQSVTVKYTVFDTMGIKKIMVYVDGKVVSEITDFAADPNNYAGSFILTERTSAQNVRIVVEDMSGNITDTEAKTFAPAYSFNRDVTVSTNFFVRWYADKPLFWGSIIGTVVLAGGIWFLIAFLKKKKEEKAAAK